MLASAAGKDTRSEYYKCYTQYTAEVEKLRQTKIEQDKDRAKLQEESTHFRARIRQERENEMRVDLVQEDQQMLDENHVWTQQQIAQLNAELQDLEQRIDEMDTAHSRLHVSNIQGLVEHAMLLKQKMLDAGCVAAAGASSAALL